MGFPQIVGAGLWFIRRPVVLAVGLALLGLVLIVTGTLAVRSGIDDRDRVQELRAGGGSVVTGTFTGAESDTPVTEQRRVQRREYCPHYAYTGSDGVERAIVDVHGCERNPNAVSRDPIRVLVDDDDPSIAFVDEEGASAGSGAEVVFGWGQIAVGVAALAGVVVVVRRRHEGATTA